MIGLNKTKTRHAQPWDNSFGVQARIPKYDSLTDPQCSYTKSARFMRYKCDPNRSVVSPPPPFAARLLKEKEIVNYLDASSVSFPLVSGF